MLKRKIDDYMSEFFRGVDCVPPRGVVVEPSLEPSHHGVNPLHSLGRVHDAVVLAFHFNESSGHSQQPQSSVHLYGFAFWHICIGGAVGEQQRFGYLLGVVKWRTVKVEVFSGPRIAVGGRNLAVRVSPVAFAPIAGVVRNSGVRNSAGKGVVLGEHILGHESAVRCRYASNLG